MNEATTFVDVEAEAETLPSCSMVGLQMNKPDEQVAPGDGKKIRGEEMMVCLGRIIFSHLAPS